MERAAVVLGFTVLVSWTGQSTSVQSNDLVPYLLGGSCLFPLLLALLRAMGSKSLMAASGWACASANDVDSTSRAASVEALRRRKGWMAETVGLASLHKALAVRYGSSRRAMMCDVVLVMDMRPHAVVDEVLALASGAERAAGITSQPGPAGALAAHYERRGARLLNAVPRSRCCCAADAPSPGALSRTFGLIQSVSLLSFQPAVAWSSPGLTNPLRALRSAHLVS